MCSQIRLLAAVSLFAFAASAMAAPQAPAKRELTPQQQRMGTCNTQATGKKGDERKAFMSSCLKGESPKGDQPLSQQEKMTSCNAEASAKDLKGDPRRTYMSSCLRK